jgi:serine/threonine protein kinase/Tfp pilus assembly protein PilF
MIGKTLGHYEITGLLGKGGMGEVYRARDTRLHREVAVKVLPESVASSPERLARFEREARTVAGLNHPNIVVLHSVEEEDCFRFLTMELIKGQTLDRIVDSGGLPLSRLLELTIQLSEALTAAHEQGIVHRDLKPGNVMVSSEGRLKVLDFGIAKLAQEDPTLEATRTRTMETPISVSGQVLGTVPYMAPEQLRGHAVDARTDLFAFGIIMYELATGKRPFTGATFADVSSAILSNMPEPLANRRADLPADIDRVVGRCLEKEPRRRYQTALDICNELRTVRRALESATPPARPAAREAPSIAVLPFMNRSRNDEDEYFSDGLADELLNVLAKIRGLRVAARTSAFYFKGKDTTIAEVGRALNVATVLEGSVRKAGNRVRISVQLVKVADGYHMWSETYDRTLEDIFAVQDDIAQSVVKELRATLLGESADSKASGEVKAEVAVAAKGRGQNAQAHRLFLQARHFLDRRNRKDSARGIEYLKEALELDPGYALAWAELGGAYSREADSGWIPVAEGHAKGREASERALALEPDLAEGRAQLAWSRILYDWDWQGAEPLFRRALELAPGNSSALRGAGRLALIHGRFEEALGLYRRALEQDPLSSNSYHTIGLAYFYAGRLIEAEEGLRKALELAPQRVISPTRLALILHEQGRREEALAEARREPDEAFNAYARAILHHAQGQAKESDEALQELIGKHDRHIAYQIAEVYGARSETDAAFDWLARARTERDPGIGGVKISPYFRSLYGDPRWQVFLNEMGFGD